MSDTIDRFLFEKRAIRGEVVSLQKSFQEVLASSEYPLAVQKLLGELMVAASLLTATLKFKGEIGLQIQSEGAVKYAIVNATHEQKLRGVAKWDEDISSFPEQFSDLFIKGVLVITLTPEEGNRYQGMVSLDKQNLSACLEDYFLQSEQLLTKVLLEVKLEEPQQAAGLLLQIVPTSSESSSIDLNEDFEHVSHLANTLKREEIFNLPHQELIYRLFHEDDLRVFEPQSVCFYCDCSKERSSRALQSISKDELLEIIQEQGEIKMDCQFCHASYTFDAIDVENIHAQNLNSGSA